MGFAARSRSTWTTSEALPHLAGLGMSHGNDAATVFGKSREAGAAVRGRVGVRVGRDGRAGLAAMCCACCACWQRASSGRSLRLRGGSSRGPQGSWARATVRRRQCLGVARAAVRRANHGLCLPRQCHWASPRTQPNLPFCPAASPPPFPPAHPRTPLAVGNISYDATEEDLHSFFSQAGEVVRFK